jgi:antitoxin (DNA-binding transcriptional repressor) of toxin-antitoxin stability system
MKITMSEFRKNTSKYVLASQIEDVEVTRYGKKVATLQGVPSERVRTALSLFGILPNKKIDKKSLRRWRLKSL